MAKILIIGAGAMGAAFSVPCLDRQHNIKIVGTHLEDKFIDELNNNNNFHPSLKLHISNNIKFLKYKSLENELKNKPDLIAICVSTKGIDWIANQLESISNNTLPAIILLTKGLSIYENKYELLIDKLERLLINKGFNNINISTIGGPCIAKELANKVRSSVIIANKNIENVKWLKDIFSTDYYNLSITNDIIGVGVCSALKNIFSIGIGAAKGLYINDKNKGLNKNLYLNTAALLTNQSIHEMSLFVDTLKGDRNTVFGLAGLGDLYVSAIGGRNSKMGFYIGKGSNYSEIIKSIMPNTTIEGADLIFEIGPKIRKDFNISNTPLMIGIINSILDDKPISFNWNNFK